MIQNHIGISTSDAAAHFPSSTAGLSDEAPVRRSPSSYVSATRQAH
jgi:hypothetical protein